MREALSGFVRERVDAVVLLGDLTETADPRALERVFRVVQASGIPVGAVGGNHDLGADAFAGVAEANSITLLANEPMIGGDAEILGLAATPVADGTGRFRATAKPELSRTRISVLGTHFPLLSEQERFDEAGLPYSGDLMDRGEIAIAVEAESIPVVVLNGHIHARCSQREGHILQLSFGALIEPPFDSAIVEVRETPTLWIDRVVRRLGPISPIDPVFSGEHESWRWHEGGWQSIGV
jgi:predicted phosphodiesterase